MGNDVNRKLSEKYCPRFAQVAVEKGFVTSEQAKKALSEQMDDNLSNKPHRLIGKIFLDKGWLTPLQIEIVLNDLFMKTR